MATPWPLTHMLDVVRLNWVQSDIPNNVESVATILNEWGFEPSFEQMTSPTMTAVPVFRKAAKHILHRLRDVGVPGSYLRMEMSVHQHEHLPFDVVLLLGDGYEFQKRESIVVVHKELALVIGARHHMMSSAFVSEPGCTGHAAGHPKFAPE